MHRSVLGDLRRSVRNLVARPPVELDPAEAYDLWAASYDNTGDNALLHVETSVVHPLLVQSALAGKNVLDAGCGTGRYFDTIQRAKPRIFCAIDASPGMLHVASSKVPSGSSLFLSQAGIRNLPFRSGTFDVVLSTLVIDHVQDLARAIGEISRVLRSGGTLVLSSFHPFGKLLSWNRSFQSSNEKWFSARYYMHSHSSYFQSLRSAHMEILHMEEPVIDDTIRPFYERADRLELFERVKGYPLLLVLTARKQ